jgi:hypothetical protein
VRRRPYITQILCAVADPIHCTEAHLRRDKAVTDRTLPKLGRRSVQNVQTSSGGRKATDHKAQARVAALTAVPRRAVSVAGQNPSAEAECPFTSGFNRDTSNLILSSAAGPIEDGARCELPLSDSPLRNEVPMRGNSRTGRLLGAESQIKV